MKYVLKYKWMLGVLLVMFTTQLFAINKTGQTGFKFLDVGVGARAAAMGEAFSLVGDDANAVFYNPAGIAYSKSTLNIALHRNYWIADIAYNAGGITSNIGNWGTVGLSFLAAEYPNSIGTIVANNEQGYEETGDLQADAYSLGFVYARQLTDKFAVGAKLQYAGQSLGTSLIPVMDGTTMTGTKERDNKASGMAYDIGTIFYPGFKSFRLGMSITNFSPQFKYEEESFQLPLTFKLGAAMDVLDLTGDHPDMNCIVDVELVHPRDYSQRMHVGGEFWFKNLVAFRAGYKFNYDEEGFSAGMGFMIQGIQVDYAYSSFGVFDSVSRFSCGFAF